MTDKRLTILIVEDESFEAAKKVAEKSGLRCVVAKTEEEANNILLEHPEIVGALIDLNFPAHKGVAPTEIGRGFARECFLNKKIFCVICTAVQWKEREDDMQGGNRYEVPSIGRKDWKKAVEVLSCLINKTEPEQRPRPLPLYRDNQKIYVGKYAYYVKGDPEWNVAKRTYKYIVTSLPKGAGTSLRCHQEEMRLSW